MSIQNKEIFFYDQDGIDKIGNIPFFLAGNSDDFRKIDEYVTKDIKKAKFIVSYIDRFNNNDIFLFIENAIKDNNKLKYIIINKEEHFSENDYKNIKKVEEVGFKKKDIILISAELDSSIFLDYSHISSHLIFGQYLHEGRNLIPSSFIKENKNIIKTKKIISSARKFNPVRENFYKQFNQNYSYLQNNYNTFRYYGLLPNCKNSEDVFGLEYKKFNHINKQHYNVSTDNMLFKEEEFYTNILSEYNNYFFSIVHETLPKSCYDYKSSKINYKNLFPFFNSKLQVGEKVLLPMITKGIFFVSGLENIEKHLNKLGIETFSDIFDIRYDQCSYSDKNEKLLQICNIINQMSIEEIKDLYHSEKIQKKINSNYEFVLYWKNQNNIKNQYLSEILNFF